jgi:hypothetical protein
VHTYVKVPSPTWLAGISRFQEAAYAFVLPADGPTCVAVFAPRAVDVASGHVKVTVHVAGAGMLQIRNVIVVPAYIANGTSMLPSGPSESQGMGVAGGLVGGGVGAGVTTTGGLVGGGVGGWVGGAVGGSFVGCSLGVGRAVALGDGDTSARPPDEAVGTTGGAVVCSAAGPP